MANNEDPKGTEQAQQEHPDEESLPEVSQPEDPEEVRAVYIAHPGMPRLSDRDLKRLPRLFPPPRWWHWWKPRTPWWWRWRERSDCCCCCCSKAHIPHPAPTPLPAAPAPAPTPPPVLPPTINLRQGWLPIGGAFYLLITHLGSRCQFVVEWDSTGGVGQLRVDLDVRDPGGSAFRRLASNLGPNDQYTFTGQRATYVFRATVRDSRGQSTFDTHTVTCP